MSFALKRSTPVWESPPVKPLDEAVWRVWKAKGRARDWRGLENRKKAWKLGSILALLAVAAFWSQVTSYEILIRCVLTAAAAGMMIEALRRQQYSLGAVFAGLALIYNPVAPVLTFSGNLQRALVIASAIPFFASLAWGDLKEAHVD